VLIAPAAAKPLPHADRIASAEIGRKQPVGKLTILAYKSISLQAADNALVAGYVVLCIICA
jgi:hypothetical protein